MQEYPPNRMWEAVRHLPGRHVEEKTFTAERAGNAECSESLLSACVAVSAVKVFSRGLL